MDRRYEANSHHDLLFDPTPDACGPSYSHAVEIDDEPECLDLDGRLLDVGKLQEICTGLIMIVQYEHSAGPTKGNLYVQLPHFSVQEYFRSDYLKGEARMFAM